VKPIVAYTLVRLGLFAVLVAVLVPLLSPWLPAYGATIIAAVVAFCVSYLAFGKLRRAVTENLAASRASKQTSTLREPAAASDEAAEDNAADARSDVSGSDATSSERDGGSKPKPE
jgi:hypothetical protein